MTPLTSTDYFMYFFIATRVTSYAMLLSVFWWRGK